MELHYTAPRHWKTARWPVPQRILLLPANRPVFYVEPAGFLSNRCPRRFGRFV